MIEFAVGIVKTFVIVLNVRIIFQSVLSPVYFTVHLHSEDLIYLLWQVDAPSQLCGAATNICEILHIQMSLHKTVDESLKEVCSSWNLFVNPWI